MASSPVSASAPTVVPVETPSLGDRSYLAHDGDVAVVVDPQRDIDRMLAVAEREGVRITHVVETHIHNDYVTGGLALAEATGAEYLVNAADQVAFDRTPIEDGQVVDVSATLKVRALATPGHTYTHLSYVLEAPRTGQTPAEPVAVFTGGSLLFGATGRPDLLGAEHTGDLVHRQFGSVRLLGRVLPDHTRVLPTHGFGSFCSSGSSASSGGVASSTIGRERLQNPVLTQSEERWVADTLAGLDAYPSYYAHMGPANLAGPSAPDLSDPAVADQDAVARAIAAGEWVVDLRTRSAFADGHVRGTINVGLDDQFATYVGWLMPWGTPLTLLGSSPDQVAEAQRELVRIGVERLEGAGTGTPDRWTDRPLDRLKRVRFADLAAVLRHRRVTVLDVRRVQEFAAGHLEGAINVPLHELPDRIGELPAGDVWVHCAGGYRASIAASLLAARGLTVTTVDDDFAVNATAAGLRLAVAA